MTITARPLPPLLRLPLELRQNIYTNLLPPSPTSHPTPSIGLTSVSHRPPPLNSLLIHPQITSEILSFYQTLATWTLILSHAFNFFRVDPQLINLERSSILNKIRKVEVVFFCDGLMLAGTPGRRGRMRGMEEELRRKAGRAADVLAQAKELKRVTVSWIEAGIGDTSADMGRVLSPLRGLTDKVGIRVGRVAVGNLVPREDGEAHMERSEFARVLADVLFGDLPDPQTGLRQREMLQLDGATDSDASQLHLLAFDPRQDRDRYQDARALAPSTPTRQKNQCVPLSGETGWPTR